MKILTLVLMLIAHFLGDYTHLSTPKMLAAKRFGKPIGPIWDHAVVHGVLMFLAIVPYANSMHLNYHYMVYGVLFETATHLIIDVLKGKCNVWFPEVADPKNKAHWYVFGFDQLLHQVVIVTIWGWITS